MSFFWGGHFEFSKSAILNFFLLHLCKKSSPFIWGIIFFCTIDGFSRILEKKGGGLLCTPLYILWYTLSFTMSGLYSRIISKEDFIPFSQKLSSFDGLLSFNWIHNKIRVVCESSAFWSYYLSKSAVLLSLDKWFFSKCSICWIYWNQKLKN